MTEPVSDPEELAFGSLDTRGVGWWGVLCLVGAEAALFAYLLFAYGFTAVQEGAAWMPAEPPHLRLAGPNTVLLLLSSAAVWWGERGIKAGKRRQLLAGYGLAVFIGIVFTGIQIEEWREKSFVISTSGYASHYFTITGFHMAHVVAGVLGLAAVMIWSALGYFDSRRHAPVLFTSLYWHFVDAVWICVFATFYLAPRFGLT